MGHIGMIAIKLNQNIKLLREYNSSLRFFRNLKDYNKKEDNMEYIEKISAILNPVCNVIVGNLSNSTKLNEDNIIKTLKKRFKNNWLNYKDNLLNLKTKLDSERFFLTEKDFTLLNDVGDAINVECINLFNRLNEWLNTIDNVRAIIIEQKNRANNLLNLIDGNIDSLLDHLIEKCTFLLEDTIDYLDFLLNELDNNLDVDIRNLFRDVRICIILLKELEYYGISALYHQTKDLRFINKLIDDIHKELSLPLDPPLAASISTKYYYYHPLTNVIFMPIGESNSLLHLPDIFHEVGHEILYYSEDNPELNEIHNSYLRAIEEINEYYDKLIAEKRREIGSKRILEIIETIHSFWKNNWIDEFFCDLFACYSLGPAYVWAHLYLTFKTSDNIYKFLIQSHPSDDSRLLFLLYTLKRIGFINEKKKYQLFGRKCH